MCFSARHQLSSALKRAQYMGDQDAAQHWRELLKQYDEWFQVSAFTHPKVIVYENDKPFEPRPAIWGLVPNWAKEPEKIWNSTVNARGETIFEKAAFRKSAETKRCLVPTDGFYDYHDFKGKKYPFYITKKNSEEPLYLAGLWNDWTNKETGEVLNTYSIVTTRANSLMAKIHNKPKFSNDPRM
ncbi:MAG TPA: SOS response-associated peptidase, partial [Tangfeifania sp.]|nr:SOS response-associated peptidase [Tangfeifania sp.]